MQIQVDRVILVQVRGMGVGMGGMGEEGSSIVRMRGDSGRLYEDAK